MARATRFYFVEDIKTGKIERMTKQEIMDKFEKSQKYVTNCICVGMIQGYYVWLDKTSLNPPSIREEWDVWFRTEWSKACVALRG